MELGQLAAWALEFDAEDDFLVPGGSVCGVGMDERHE